MKEILKQRDELRQAIAALTFASQADRREAHKKVCETFELLDGAIESFNSEFPPGYAQGAITFTSVTLADARTLQGEE
jgi:hypothetical protein